MARKPLPRPLAILLTLAFGVVISWVGLVAVQGGRHTVRWVRQHRVLPNTQPERAYFIRSELRQLPDLGPRWVWTLQPVVGGPPVFAVLIDGGPSESLDTLSVYRVAGSGNEVRLTADSRPLAFGFLLIIVGSFVGLLGIALSLVALRGSWPTRSRPGATTA